MVARRQGPEFSQTAAVIRTGRGPQLFGHLNDAEALH
jgi:hypothetical protein